MGEYQLDATSLILKYVNTSHDTQGNNTTDHHVLHILFKHFRLLPTRKIIECSYSEKKQYRAFLILLISKMMQL